ncbi:hypothetical protein PoB_004919300 [Plakobranchus ocellatus]|uniref:Secreted protein n=1 Tax=Plakobranchus ocellatus TaxID=259542 RepID=A0AAV4BSV6_9GAST|nr:hypothetical protein PoB_004919300 [Plakobranchus ocellatus]
MFLVKIYVFILLVRPMSEVPVPPLPRKLLIPKAYLRKTQAFIFSHRPAFTHLGNSGYFNLTVAITCDIVRKHKDLCFCKLLLLSITHKVRTLHSKDYKIRRQTSLQGGLSGDRKTKYVLQSLRVSHILKADSSSCPATIRWTSLYRGQSPLHRHRCVVNTMETSSTGGQG